MEDVTDLTEWRRKRQMEGALRNLDRLLSETGHHDHASERPRDGDEDDLPF